MTTIKLSKKQCEQLAYLVRMALRDDNVWSGNDLEKKEIKEYNENATMGYNLLRDMKQDNSMIQLYLPNNKAE